MECVSDAFAGHTLLSRARERVMFNNKFLFV